MKCRVLLSDSTLLILRCRFDSTLLKLRCRLFMLDCISSCAIVRNTSKRGTVIESSGREQMDTVLPDLTRKEVSESACSSHDNYNCTQGQHFSVSAPNGALRTLGASWRIRPVTAGDSICLWHVVSDFGLVGCRGRKGVRDLLQN